MFRKYICGLSFPQLSPLRVAACLTINGHFSTQTRACANRLNHVLRQVHGHRSRVSLLSLHCDCMEHSLPRVTFTVRCFLQLLPGRRHLDTGQRVISHSRHSGRCKSDTVLSYSSCLNVFLGMDLGFHAVTTVKSTFLLLKSMAGRLARCAGDSSLILQELHQGAWQQSSFNKTRLSSSRQLGRIMNSLNSLRRVVDSGT